jgi:hypothetical protein
MHVILDDLGHATIWGVEKLSEGFSMLRVNHPDPCGYPNFLKFCETVHNCTFPLCQNTDKIGEDPGFCTSPPYHQISKCFRSRKQARNHVHVRKRSALEQEVDKNGPNLALPSVFHTFFSRFDTKVQASSNQLIPVHRISQVFEQPKQQPEKSFWVVQRASYKSSLHMRLAVAYDSAHLTFRRP